jgi:small subunit ribosomal protein S17
MAKVFTGKVVSTKMQDTAVVEVIRLLPHPLYKKLLKRSKNYKVDTKEQAVVVGQTVEIVETRPTAKDKHFKVKRVIEKTHTQTKKAEGGAKK